MSGSYVYEDERDRYGYLSDVCDTLILRDIRQKHGVRNARLLERLSDYLMDNVSNITSARSVADALTSAGTKTNDRTISSYMSHLEEAFAFYRVKRYTSGGSATSRPETSTTWRITPSVTPSSGPATWTSAACWRTWWPSSS